MLACIKRIHGITCVSARRKNLRQNCLLSTAAMDFNSKIDAHMRRIQAGKDKDSTIPAFSMTGGIKTLGARLPKTNARLRAARGSVGA
jgi:hypothetical protein